MLASQWLGGKTREERGKVPIRLSRAQQGPDFPTSHRCLHLPVAPRAGDQALGDPRPKLPQ